MGVVYAAHDERLDRPVAIKRIRPDLTLGQARERFWREARAASSVSHPHVCQLYEIDEDGSGLFLTMELLEGEPPECQRERWRERREAGAVSMQVQEHRRLLGRAGEQQHIPVRVAPVVPDA